MQLPSKKVAVIGLGDMGSALARSFVSSGVGVRVWNRSQERAAAMQQEGAVACASVEDAIDGCSAVVVCLSNYAAWKEIAGPAEVRAKLLGATVIQLTGGTMSEVQEHAALMTGCGSRLIEGAILCFPDQIGTDDASIIVAGPQDTVTACDPVLRIMSPDIAYLGENYAAPVVLSRAAVSSMIGFLIGTVNGAAMCEAGGVPLSAFRNQVAKNAEMMRTETLRLVDAIAAGDTKDTQASLGVWAEGHTALLNVSEKLGIETQFHNGIRSMFKKALDQGLGGSDLSAMVQTFRSGEPGAAERGKG